MKNIRAIVLCVSRPQGAIEAECLYDADENMLGSQILFVCGPTGLELARGLRGVPWTSVVPRAMRKQAWATLFWQQLRAQLGDPYELHLLERRIRWESEQFKPKAPEMKFGHCPKPDNWDTPTPADQPKLVRTIACTHRVGVIEETWAVALEPSVTLAQMGEAVLQLAEAVRKGSPL